MFQISYTTLIFCFCTHFCNGKNIFDLDPDDILKSMIGVLHQKPHRIPFPDIKSLLHPKKDKSTTKMVLKKTTPSMTTEKAALQTKNPTLQIQSEITLEDINKRKMNMNFAKLLTQRNSIPDFANNADDPTYETRRFDAIQERSESDRNEPNDYLRQEYFYFENATKILMEKNKTIELMAHYIYETRYKLPYAELMRVKYKEDIRYKIGYCFSLLRQLKQQQRMIYTTFVNNYIHTLTLHFHMKMYEKVVRLDVDVRDLIQFIKNLDKERKIADDKLYNDHKT